MQATDKKPETLLTVYNTTLDYISWSHILDLYRTTVYQWVSRKGKEYAAEKIKYILNHPVDLKDPEDMKKYIKKSDIDDKRKKMLTINGETKYLNQWANKIGCTQSLISHWIKEYGKTYAAKMILEKINHPSKIISCI